MRYRALWPIAETGDRFADFRPYVASIDDAGTVAFQATLAGGGEGIFTGGYAAPPGGPLAIDAGADSEADRVLGIGDAALGSRIATFILNPVSMNERGQLALRLELEDGRQAIARLDPE